MEEIKIIRDSSYTFKVPSHKKVSAMNKAIKLMTDNWLETQEILCNIVVSEGKELYTSQDGCYAEYEYCSFVYVLRFDSETNTKYISVKGEK